MTECKLHSTACTGPKAGNLEGPQGALLLVPGALDGTHVSAGEAWLGEVLTHTIPAV
jgi:hypothetical protein